MNQIVPSQFLFRWSFAAKRLAKSPSGTGRLLDLPDDYELPSLAELQGGPSFAKVKMGWNEEGIGLSFTIEQKSRPPKFVAGELLLCDRVQIWIDTRNTQNVHRATRFCHCFVLLPLSDAKRNQPIVRSVLIPRSREDAVLPKAEFVKAQVEVSPTGYRIDAWFPEKTFTGYDPVPNPKIGFHYAVYDNELGEQTLAVGSEFPYESDPSLWQTVELIT